MYLFFKVQQLKLCSMLLITQNNVAIYFSAKITLYFDEKQLNTDLGGKLINFTT